MILLFSVIAAVIPTLIYISIIYWFDRYEKEPTSLLIAAFLWGAIPSIIAALIINTTLSVPFYLLSEGVGDFVGASIVAPFVEESLKGFALLAIFFLWRHELDSYLDGIIYGAMVGIGFAMVENVFYFLDAYDSGGFGELTTLIFLRAVIFGLNHSLFTSMTGLGLAVTRLSNKNVARYIAPFVGWSLAVLLHAIHNATATIGSFLIFFTFLSDFGGLFILLVIIIWALWQESHWIHQYLAEEMTAGILTAEQYKVASSTLQRTLATWGLLLSGKMSQSRKIRYFYDKCSELAYKKHHYELFSHHKDLERIETLRTEITQLNGAYLV